MADEASLSELMMSVKNISDNIIKIQQSQSDMGDRLNKIEQKEIGTLSGSIEKDSDEIVRNVSPQASDNDDDINNEDQDGVFQRSDDEEEEMEFKFNPGNVAKHIGKDIGGKLAMDINSALLGTTDLKALQTIQDNNPIPGNLPNLCVPEMNEEIDLGSTRTQNREVSLCFIQREIGTAVGILSQMVNDIGKKKNREFSRENLFVMINETMTLLSQAHKMVTQERKFNVRPFLHPKLHKLCGKRSKVERSSNRFVFEENLAAKIEELVRNTKVMNGPKNFRGYFGPRGFRRGKGSRYPRDFQQSRGSQQRGGQQMRSFSYTRLPRRRGSWQMTRRGHQV